MREAEADISAVVVALSATKDATTTVRALRREYAARSRVSYDLGEVYL
jgi:hypothetical protein